MVGGGRKLPIRLSPGAAGPGDPLGAVEQSAYASVPAGAGASGSYHDRRPSELENKLPGDAQHIIEIEMQTLNSVDKDVDGYASRDEEDEGNGEGPSKLPAWRHDSAQKIKEGEESVEEEEEEFHSIQDGVVGNGKQPVRDPG